MSKSDLKARKSELKKCELIINALLTMEDMVETEELLLSKDEQAKANRSIEFLKEILKSYGLELESFIDDLEQKS